MSATDLYKAMLRDQVGPALREQGFRGSGSRWLLTSASGDAAIVNAQSSMSSSRDEVLFIVNVAVVPEPWWAWQQVKLGTAAGKVPTETAGLWRDRIHARAGRFMRGDGAWWSVRDAESARQCGDDVVEQLRTETLPRLVRLLDRSAMIDAARQCNLGFAKGEQYRLMCDFGLAVLLADAGPSPELDDVIARILAHPEERTRQVREAITSFAHQRAAVSS